MIAVRHQPPKCPRRERTSQCALLSAFATARDDDFADLDIVPPAAATRRAAATSIPSAAPTAADARPRTRRSSASPSATWSSLLLFVCRFADAQNARDGHSLWPSLALPPLLTHLTATDLWFPLQVISRTPRFSPSTPFPRCTSSCSTAFLAPSTARSFGTCLSTTGGTTAPAVLWRLLLRQVAGARWMQG